MTKCAEECWILRVVNKYNEIFYTSPFYSRGDVVFVVSFIDKKQYKFLYCIHVRLKNERL